MAAVARSAVRVARPIHHPLYGDVHRQIQASLSKLIDDKINPHVEEWENGGIFPAHHVFPLLASLGVFGVNKPPEFGGLGLDFSYSCAVAETLGRVHCGSIPMASSVQSDMATPALARFGSDALRAEFLLPSLRGEKVACLAVSEPSAGSDVASIRSTARRTATGDWCLNGHKMWITNGGQADWACVLANTNQNEDIHRNKSLLCVRMDSPGIHRNTNIRKLGMHSSDTAEIIFDDVIVPRDNVIGEEGHGFVYQMMQFQDERLTTVAVALEPLQRCIHLTLQYTHERRAFGKPLLNNQVIQFRLSELQTELESLRSILYRAVIERVQGNDVTVLASMAKLKAGRLSREVTDSCLQFFGGSGFTWDNPVTRMHRDLRVFSIGAGSDETMLSIISRHLTKGLL